MILREHEAERSFLMLLLKSWGEDMIRGTQRAQQESGSRLEQEVVLVCSQTTQDLSRATEFCELLLLSFVPLTGMTPAGPQSRRIYQQTRYAVRIQSCRCAYSKSLPA